MYAMCIGQKWILCSVHGMQCAVDGVRDVQCAMFPSPAAPSQYSVLIRVRVRPSATLPLSQVPPSPLFLSIKSHVGLGVLLIEGLFLEVGGGGGRGRGASKAGASSFIIH